MGTNVAPVIANLYLALKFDSKIKSLANIKYFRRYIDDCFILYKGDLKQFINFEFTILQKTIAPIKLTYEFNMSSINFLDLTIFKDNGSNSFATKIYQKALNKYNYIPMFSNHPKSNIRGFIIGELNRYTLSSSFKNDCSLVFDLFFDRLKMRGYPRKFLTQCLAKFELRNKQEIKPQVLSLNTLNIVLRYSNQPILLQKIKIFLQLIAKTILNDPNHPIRIAYISNPSVFKLILRSALSPDQVQYLHQH